MPARSPYVAACSKVPPNKSVANVKVDFPDWSSMAAVEIEKPKSLGERFWRSSAYLLALFPGALAADAAARAFENAHSTVVVTTIAPVHTSSNQIQQPAQSPPPHATSPMISFLRPALLAAGGAIATEALKEAGKDLWKAIKKKLWPETAPATEPQSNPSGTFTMTVNVDDIVESDGFVGSVSESQLENFVNYKLSELYGNIESKRNTPANVYTKRKQRVSVTFTHIPPSGSSVGKTSASVSLDPS